MHPSTIGTAILAAFGAVGAVPSAGPQIGEPVISPTLPQHDQDQALAIAVNTTQSAPELTYLFSATLDLDPVLQSFPIPGGVREVQVFTGRIEGPALNATINTGIAAPMITSNGDLRFVAGTIFGTTEDNSTIYAATQVDVGPVNSQITSLDLEVSGRSAYLTDCFVIARISFNNATRQVHMDAYEIV